MTEAAGAGPAGAIPPAGGAVGGPMSEEASATGGHGGSPAVTGPAGRNAVEEVLVLDFGGQYSQLIARRIRECGVFSELLPATASIDSIRERGPKALVLSGG